MDEREIRRFKYTTSAIDRIRAMDKNAITGFFKEVPPGRRKSAVATLPNPPGFRAGSQAGVDRKVQLLANRLVGLRTRKPTSIQRDLNVLGCVWMLWGTEHLGAPDAINECVDRSQRPQPDDLAEDDTGRNREDPLATELFQRLHDLSHSNRCGREDIKRFLDFSPFSATEGLLRILEACKPVDVVERDKAIAELPDRLATAEQDIADLSEIVDALSKNIETDAKGILHRDVQTLQRAVSETTETMSDISDRFDALRSEMAVQTRRATEHHSAQENSGQKAATSLKKLQDDLAAIVDHIEPLSRKSDKADKAITGISLELDQLRECIAEFRPIADRVSALEPPLDTGTNPEARAVTSTRAIAVQKRALSDAGPSTTQLGEVDEFIGAVRTNLELLSIKKSSAEALALECIAALLAGQMPYFSGLNGRRVAQACATALAAQDTHILTMPVGISSPDEFRHHLESLPDDERQSVGCLIIDGINRSALDTFGECLVELVSRQRSGDPTSRAMLTIATLTDGPASLPLSIAHVSLGPVFSTDALDWHSRARTHGQMTFGGIPTAEWEAACSIAEPATPETEEALRLLGEFAPFVNPLLRATVLSGFRALSALPKDRAGPTALQSLAFGWLTPLCIAAGTTSEAVDREFDQGILDGKAPDTRLANLLRSGIFASAQSGQI